MDSQDEKEIIGALKSIASSLQALVTFAQAASQHFDIQQPVVQPPKRPTFRP